MTNTFQFFDASHLSVLALVAFLSVSLPILTLRMGGAGSRTDWVLRWSLAGIIAVNEIIYWITDAVSGTWNIQTGIPIQICDMLVFMCPFALLFPKRFPFLSELTYFWALSGTLQALITPSFAAPFPSYIFFKFFTTHGAVIIGAVYLVSVLGVRPDWRSAMKAFFATNLWALLVGIFNFFFHTNYMFLAAKPSRPSLIDFFGPWPFYLLALEIFAMICFLILVLPFRKAER